MPPRFVLRVKSGSLQELLAEIRAKGGRPIQAFAPSHVIAVLPAGTQLDLGEISSQPDATSSSVTAHRTLATMESREAAGPEPTLSWDMPGKKPPMFHNDSPSACPAQASRSTAIRPAYKQLFDKIKSYCKKFSDKTKWSYKQKVSGRRTFRDGGTATGRYMVGRVAVALVIVGRQRGTDPNPPAEFLTTAERDAAATQISAGLGWLALEEPRARVEFVFDRTDIELAVVPSATTPDTFEDRESVWRDPALAKMGYPANAAGYARLAHDVRDNNGARWGFVIFVTRYPVHHFAYANAERLVVHYDNDGWGPSELDRVIAHQVCHIFGALDEYTSSGCTCTQRGGALHIENGNCRSCATDFVQCLMEANTFSVCDFTRRQIGWRSPLMASLGKALEAGSNADGRIEVFYIGIDDVLYHTWQLPRGNWIGEYHLGPSSPAKTKQFAVGRNEDGRIEVFYIGLDDVLYHNWQLVPNGKWIGENML